MTPNQAGQSVQNTSGSDGLSSPSNSASGPSNSTSGQAGRGGLTQEEQKTGLKFSGWTWDPSQTALFFKVVNVSNEVQDVSVNQFYIKKSGSNSIPAGVIDGLQGGGFDDSPGEDIYSTQSIQLNPGDYDDASFQFQVSDGTPISGYTLFMVIDGYNPVAITTFN